MVFCAARFGIRQGRELTVGRVDDEGLRVSLPLAAIASRFLVVFF